MPIVSFSMDDAALKALDVFLETSELIRSEAIRRSISEYLRRQKKLKEKALAQGLPDPTRAVEQPPKKRRGRPRGRHKSISQQQKEA